MRGRGRLPSTKARQSTSGGGGGDKDLTDWKRFRKSWADPQSPLDEMLNVSGVASVNQHLVEELRNGKWRLHLYVLLHTSRFKVFISTCIFTTLMVTWLETDYGAEDRDVPVWVTVINWMLFAVYACEVTIRMLLEQCFFFRSGWNNADLFFVLSDMFVFSVRIAAPDSDTFKWLRLARIVRVVRVVRVLRFAIVFRELYMIVHGMMSIGRALFWASGLMFLVLSMCSILAVELLKPYMAELVEAGDFEDCHRCAASFDSVWNANLLWIQSMVAGDGWGQTALPVIDKHPWAATIFLAVLIICQLGLLNLILTVMLDTAMESRAEDDAHLLMEKENMMKKAFEYLSGICAELDVDDSGELSLDEILDGYKSNAEFKGTLKLMDIEPDDLATVFQMMDADGSGTVSYQEFVDQVHKMKTSDSHTLLIFIKHYVQKLEKGLTVFMKEHMQKHANNLNNIKDTQQNLETMISDVLKGQVAASSNPPLVEAESERSPMTIPEQKLVSKRPSLSGSESTNGAELGSRVQAELERHKKELLQLLAEDDKEVKGIKPSSEQAEKGNEAEALGEGSKQDKADIKAVKTNRATDAVSKLIFELDAAGRELDSELGEPFSNHLLTNLDSVSEEISAKIESLRHQVRSELVQALKDAAKRLNSDRSSGPSKDRMRSPLTSSDGNAPLAGQKLVNSVADGPKGTDNRMCASLICEPKNKRRQSASSNVSVLSFSAYSCGPPVSPRSPGSDE